MDQPSTGRRFHQKQDREPKQHAALSKLWGDLESTSQTTATAQFCSLLHLVTTLLASQIAESHTHLGITNSYSTQETASRLRRLGRDARKTTVIMRAQNPMARAPSRRNPSISINTGSASRPAMQTLPLMGSSLQRRPRTFSTVLPSLVENCTEAKPPVAEYDKTTASGVVGTGVTGPRKLYGGSVLPAFPSRKSIDVSLETDEFLDYVNNSLRLRDPTSFLDAFESHRPTLERVRSSSSSYDCDSKSNSAPKHNAPASPPPENTLKEPDILKYSRSGNCLSDLHTSSSNSRGDSTTNVVDESAAAAAEWQTIPRPRTSFCYNRCELIDSQEILPSDSVSQVRVDDSPEPPKPKKTVKSQLIGRYKQAFRPSNDSLRPIKGQYDGVGDSPSTRNLDSPHPDAARPLHANAKRGAGAGQKRKASNLSLASISSQTKKGAKKLKTLASSVFLKSSQHLSEVKRKLKKQNEKEKKRFEAWKANRRRERPGDALKRKGEPSFGAFTVEQSRHGHKDWWREGVTRYKAPSWMVFGGERPQ